MVIANPKKDLLAFSSTSPLETAQIAKHLSAKIQPGEIITLEAPLGAGKTTFCQYFIREFLGDESLLEVTSPTFGLMSQYCKEGIVICHFDLYRLDSLQDFLKRGFEEYLHEKNTICLVEWPEFVVPILNPKKTWNCKIEMGPFEERLFTIEKLI